MDQTTKPKSKHNAPKTLYFDLSHKQTDLNGLIATFNFSLELCRAFGNQRYSFSVSQRAETSHVYHCSPVTWSYQLSLFSEEATQLAIRLNSGHLFLTCALLACFGFLVRHDLGFCAWNLVCFFLLCQLASKKILAHSYKPDSWFKKKYHLSISHYGRINAKQPWPWLTQD